MKLDVPDDYVPLLITALEHHYPYTRAVKREDTRYLPASRRLVPSAAVTDP